MNLIKAYSIFQVCVGSSVCNNRQTIKDDNCCCLFSEKNMQPKSYLPYYQVFPDVHLNVIKVICKGKQSKKYVQTFTLSRRGEGHRSSFWVRKNFRSEKKFKAEKNFGSKINVWSKNNFGSKKMLSPKKILAWKNFGSEKNFGPKKIWVWKNFRKFFFIVVLFLLVTWSLNPIWPGGGR